MGLVFGKTGVRMEVKHIGGSSIVHRNVISSQLVVELICSMWLL